MPNINYTSPIQPESGDKHKGAINNRPGKGAGNVVKIVAIIAAVIAVFVAGIIMLVFSVLSGVTGVSNEFMDALMRGEPGIAYDMAADGFREQGPREQFESYVNDNPVLSDIGSYSFSAYQMQNNYGTARGTVTSASGRVSPVLLELVEENGEWKVLGLSLNPPPAVDDDFDETDTSFMDF